MTRDLGFKFLLLDMAIVSVADRLVSSQVSHHLVCHRFCPQALAKALKVNRSVRDIGLEGNQIGNEEAEAWCVAWGSAVPGLETGK